MYEVCRGRAGYSLVFSFKLCLLVISSMFFFKSSKGIFLSELVMDQYIGKYITLLV